jgi:hypothetical protein
MPRLAVIEGGRHPEFVHEERRLARLIKAGASIRIESAALVVLIERGIRLAQLKNALSRCRVRGFEANAESFPRILCVDAIVPENPDESGQQFAFREYALKVMVEESAKPGSVVVIGIGRFEES